jgi:hypothetical protein
MRDYVIRWMDCREGMLVSKIPTPVIIGMLEYAKRGEPIDPEGEDMEGVLERLRLELQIRAWGLL